MKGECNVKRGHKEIPIGGKIDKPATSLKYKTGNWKIFHPHINFDECINCHMCVHFCPDDCFLVKEGKMSGVNMDYCKGCGICAQVCPKKCIKMKKGEPDPKNVRKE